MNRCGPCALWLLSSMRTSSSPGPCAPAHFPAPHSGSSVIALTMVVKSGESGLLCCLLQSCTLQRYTLGTPMPCCCLAETMSSMMESGRTGRQNSIAINIQDSLCSIEPVQMQRTHSDTNVSLSCHRQQDQKDYIAKPSFKKTLAIVEMAWRFWRKIETAWITGLTASHIQACNHLPSRRLYSPDVTNQDVTRHPRVNKSRYFGQLLDRSCGLLHDEDHSGPMFRGAPSELAKCCCIASDLSVPHPLSVRAVGLL